MPLRAGFLSSPIRSSSCPRNKCTVSREEIYFTLFCSISWNRKIFGRITSWLALQKDIERQKKSRTHKSTENKPQDRFSWGHYSGCREISEMNDGDLLIQRFKSSKVLRDEKKGLI